MPTGVLGPERQLEKPNGPHSSATCMAPGSAQAAGPKRETGASRSTGCDSSMPAMSEEMGNDSGTGQQTRGQAGWSQVDTWGRAGDTATEGLRNRESGGS